MQLGSFIRRQLLFDDLVSHRHRPRVDVADLFRDLFPRQILLPQSVDALFVIRELARIDIEPVLVENFPRRHHPSHPAIAVNRPGFLWFDCVVVRRCNCGCGFDDVILVACRRSAA